MHKHGNISPREQSDTTICCFDFQTQIKLCHTLLFIAKGNLLTFRIVAEFWKAHRLVLHYPVVNDKYVSSLLCSLYYTGISGGVEIHPISELHFVTFLCSALFQVGFYLEIIDSRKLCDYVYRNSFVYCYNFPVIW